MRTRCIMPVQRSVCLLIQQSLLFWLCCFLSVAALAVEETPQNNCWVYAATTPRNIVPGSESVNPAHAGQAAVNYWNPADTFLGLVVVNEDIVIGVRVLFNNGDVGTISTISRRPYQTCPIQQKCHSCEGEGNPVDPATGNKFQVETDYSDRFGELTLVRRYNSADMYRVRSVFGRGWSSVLDQGLIYDFTHNIAYLRRPDGRQLRYRLYAGDDPYQLFFPNTRLFDPQGNELPVPTGSFRWVPDADITAVLDSRYNTEGDFIGWVYRTPAGDTEYYNVGGGLERIVRADGQALEITRETNVAGEGLITLRSGSRTLQIRVESINGFTLVRELTDPSGQVTRYAYSEDRLVQVIYPDQTPGTEDNPRKQYHYENLNHPGALTGISDETGQRFTRWEYDSEGRAITSEHAGGVGRVTLSYGEAETTVTDAAGAVRTREYTEVQNRPRLSRILGGRCPECGEVAFQVYDANGFVVQTQDWNGVETVYTRDDQGLETSRTEAFNTPEARTIHTDWHPVYRLPIRITEPTRITEFVYDDPNGTANVLEKREIDISGACAPGSNPPPTLEQCERITVYTYYPPGHVNEHRVHQIDGPRTDVNDITTFEYDSAGNQIRMINALGHQTEITEHDNHGNPLRIIDPNGVITALQYDARQRLIQRTHAAGTTEAATTQFDYAPNGLLERVTDPIGVSLHYHYDAAQRLTAIEDALGNRITYTLDNAGNRTQTDTRDPQGTLTQTQTAIYTSLSRLSQQLGADNQTTSYQYDHNGNRTQITDPKQQTTIQTYDPLNRLVEQLDPADGITRYDYNAADQLIRVEDPNTLDTEYHYNGFDELIYQNSPDTGEMHYQYDQAGNLIEQTDARGVTVNYRYDALNRLIRIDYPDTPGGIDEDVHYTYDQTDPDSSGQVNYGIGRLTRIQEASGQTQYHYGRRGNRITADKIIHTDPGGTATISLTIHYAYDSADRLTQITYPSGRTINYQHNAAGQINQVSTTQNGQTQILADQITYRPFGPLQQATLGNGLMLNYHYDMDARLNQQTTVGIHEQTYAYDLNSNIEQITRPTNPGQNQTLNYDTLDRLIQADSPAANHSYSYGPTGNRLSKTDNGQTNTYSYIQGSHQLESVSGTQPQNYQYDAAGNPTQRNNDTFTYNPAGRLARIETADQTIEYQYNAQGQRTLKYITEGSDTQATLYVYNLEGLLIAELNNTGETQVEYAYLNSQPLAQINATNAEIFYYHNDHLGTPQKLTNSQGTIVWEATYSPFGQATVNEDPDNDGNPVTQNIRFPGQYYDQETGLHYNWFRYYDPEVGRYITSDPIGLEGGLSTYSYVDGNPINRTDETGKIWQLPALFCAKFPRICKEVLSCLRNPSQCKGKFCRAGNKLYKSMCNNMGCRLSDSPATAKTKLALAEGCFALRVAVRRICFSNKPDKTHDDEIRKARVEIEKCKQLCN